MHPILNISGRGFVFPFIYTKFAVIRFDILLANRLLLLSIPPRCEMRRVFSIFVPINLIRNMEQVNHPQHYTTYDVETIDMMLRIWGVQETISFCKLNAFKYRMRAGHKDNAQQDIDKALWYENKMKELSSCIPE